MATLQEALNRFGVVTVLEPTFQKLDLNGQPVGSTFTLDSLRISNFTEEGPRKTARGGINAEVVMRYGKTARLEMEDVVGKLDVLTNLFNAKLVESSGTASATETFTAIAGQTVFKLSRTADTLTGLTINTVESITEDLDATGQYVTITDVLSDGDVVVITYDYTTYDSLQITDSFAGYYEISGRTFVINPQTGNREYINIFVHRFLPDGLLNLTMEAEGDFGVFNIAGELFTNDCGVFYEFTKGDQPAECL